MCFREAQIPPFVDSARGRITQQLEIKALRFARHHRRISGFWQISWLKHAAPGLETFIVNNGTMELLIGLPCEESYDDLILASRNLGSEEYRRRVRDEFLRHLLSSPSFHDTQSRELLEQLIASGRLQMRILPNAGPNAKPEHGKMQIYYDDCDPPCWILADGSKNDSDHGDRGGVDFMTVTRSWNGDQRELKAGFEKYFANRWDHPNTVDLGDEATAVLLERLRTPLPADKTPPVPDSVSSAFELLKLQENSDALAIVPAREAPEILEAFSEIGVPPTTLAVLGVDDPKIVLIVSQYVEEKPLAVLGNTPSDALRLQAVWDGPSVLFWGDRLEFCDHDAVFDAERFAQELVKALGIDVRDEKTELYRYNHPAGPQQHQLRAIELWRSNGRRALFEHATGTYKTATGMTVAAELLSAGETPLVVVAAPQISIADNWAHQAHRDFDHPDQVRVVQCYSGHAEWADDLEHYSLGSTPTLAIFVNDSLWKNHWWHVLRQYKPAWALIADEAHNWVIYSTQAQEFMSRVRAPSARLALTAQLADPLRPEEATPVLEWFASSKALGVDTFGLAEAMRHGFLREYDYEVRPVALVATDFAADAGALLRQYQRTKQDQAVTAVLDLCRTHDRVLLYTGPAIDDAKQLAADVKSRLTAADNFAVETFTSQESPKDRARILRDFRAGLTKVLVAVRCLDEGVDLPVADAAVMCLANEDERQWIQRRGRILRIAADQDRKTAMIVDFLPSVPASLPSVVAAQLREATDREARRALAFAKLARLSSRAEVLRVLARIRPDLAEAMNDE